LNTTIFFIFSPLLKFIRTIFSIASGVATGLATLYLSNKLGGSKVTKGSVILAGGVVIAASLGTALLLRKVEGV